MNFKVISSNGERVKCRLLFAFHNQDNNFDYVVYSDGSKDSNGNDAVFASRYVKIGEDYQLEDIENDSEWDLVDIMLDKYNRGVNLNE